MKGMGSQIESATKGSQGDGRADRRSYSEVHQPRKPAKDRRIGPSGFRAQCLNVFDCSGGRLCCCCDKGRR
jgi:hypothetical protein